MHELLNNELSCNEFFYKNNNNWKLDKLRRIINIMLKIDQILSIENWQVKKSFVKIIYNYLHILSNHCFHLLQWVKQVRYVCVVHVMHHIIISFFHLKNLKQKKKLWKG
jgi:hypothetical protein